MSRDTARAATQFFGGRICLDFANTVDWRTSGAPQELIPDYAAFLSWSERRGTLLPRAAAALRRLGKQEDVAAARVLREAYALRAAIWSAAEALRGAGTADLAAFNRMLATLPAQPRLVGHGARFAYDLRGRDLREPLWPVLWSLTAVLTSEDADRVGCCRAEGCGWLFVDESPNRTRLWCSSAVCGNRERARRAYSKRRAGR
ncbi:MAG TPA: ABATE domain-containing protein [Stellaceae bacterium]|nr:ABATE domain-containing protein [Stellaceae bacterium]